MWIYYVEELIIIKCFNIGNEDDPKLLIIEAIKSLKRAAHRVMSQHKEEKTWYLSLIQNSSEKKDIFGTVPLHHKTFLDDSRYKCFYFKFSQDFTKWRNPKQFWWV